MRSFILGLLLLAAQTALALKYDSREVEYNLNQNQGAQSVLEYSGQWDNHTFHPSPQNWRFPFYTLFLDRFVNGDPTNDNANGTLFEQDPLSTQFRHGGDLAGLLDTLDYIQGMGIKASTTIAPATTWMHTNYDRACISQDRRFSIYHGSQMVIR
jgi:alpha-1,3-glucan synthase